MSVAVVEGVSVGISVEDGVGVSVAVDVGAGRGVGVSVGVGVTVKVGAGEGVGKTEPSSDSSGVKRESPRSTRSLGLIKGTSSLSHPTTINARNPEAKNTAQAERTAATLTTTFLTSVRFISTNYTGIIHRRSTLKSAYPDSGILRD